MVWWCERLPEEDYLARGITIYRRDGLLHHPLWAAGTIVHFWDPRSNTIVALFCGVE